MAVSEELEYASIDDLLLDPLNPRMGKKFTETIPNQEEILEVMSEWSLEELAVSFLDAKVFWTHEALLVVDEGRSGDAKLVVVEGNRRLAALRCLKEAVGGSPRKRKWKELVEGVGDISQLFERVPYFLVDSREEIMSFLGFRHVTGIKEWKPAEKAAFIAEMVDEQNMSYEQVMRKIGSTTPAVRRHYISYRLLLQIEDAEILLPEDQVAERFSVMYLSLRTEGVRTYLDIDIDADPEAARRPIPDDHLENLANFARWLFGDTEHVALFSDSRRVDDFGRILLSVKATDYLERNKEPRFDVALRMAGGDEPEIVRLVDLASDNVELALARAHAHKKSKDLSDSVERLGRDAHALVHVFPSLEKKLKDEWSSEESG